jgi:uncharacterized protein
MLFSFSHQFGLDAYGLAFLSIAALASGLVRGFTGFGYAMIFVPLAAVIIGPIKAMALIWFMDLPFALPLAYRSRDNAEMREVTLLVIGATLLFPIGLWLLVSLDPISVRWVVVTLILLAVATMASGWRYKGSPGKLLSLSVGGLSGITGGLANMGGMPLAVFWLAAQKNDPQKTKDNVNMFFGVEAVFSGVLLWWSGILTWAGAQLALLLCIPFGLGLLLGMKGFHLASQETFRHVAYAIITLAALLAMPLFDGLIR